MDDRDKMLDVTLTQIEKQFGKGAVMKLGEHPMGAGISVIPTGLARARHRARRRAGSRAGASSRSSGPRARARPPSASTSSPRRRTHGGIAAFIDAEHALDPTYAQRARREHRRAPGLPARLRRAGARDRRHARALGRARRGRDRLGGGARAPGRDRGRDGRHPRRPAGAADVAGDAQALGHALAVRHHGDLHQPAPREDRRDVRQPRDHPGRPRAEVLLLGPAGRAQDREPQGRDRRRRLAHAGQGREEQGRAAVPPVRVRHHVRQGHLQGGSPPRRRRRPRDRQEERAPGSPTRASSSGRAARTRAQFLAEHTDIATRSSGRCARRSG